MNLKNEINEKEEIKENFKNAHREKVSTEREK
jgi:hypothetical protein